MRYTIVIPCYNEEDNLPLLVDRISSFSKRNDIEFIFVENGSTDNSYALMLSLIKDLPFIRIVKVEVNQGYGYGLYQGIRAAKGDYIGWIHADLQLAINDVTLFLEQIDNYQGMGKLFLKGTRHNRSFIDYIFTYSQGLFDSILFGLWMFDISAIPTFFDRSLLDRINNVPKDFSIEIYMYVLAKKSGFHVERIPVHLHKRERGKSSWNTGIGSRIKQSAKIIKASINIKKNI